MSVAPIMVDCPGCLIKFGGKKSSGFVMRKIGSIYYKDICTKCGGSGRVAL